MSSIKKYIGCDRYKGQYILKKTLAILFHGNKIKRFSTITLRTGKKDSENILVISKKREIEIGRSHMVNSLVSKGKNKTHIKNFAVKL